MPVEARIDSIDTAGKVTVGFTREVNFLTELKDQVSNVTAVNQRRLEDGLKPVESPLEVLVVPTEDRDEEDVTA